MDTVVLPTGADTWHLKDRLGRELGTIKQKRDGKFSIMPAVGKLPKLSHGPFNSLDLAMAEIERVTRGACQLSTGM